MSRRAGNNVRGPTSALTSFLQAQGINAASIARRVQLQNAAQEQNQENANANAAGDGQEEGQQAGPRTAESASASPRRRARRGARTSGYASDDLDAPSPSAASPQPTSLAPTQPPSSDLDEQEEQEEPTQPAPKRRKLTKAAEAKLKAAAKKRARKAKGGSEYEESDDEDDGEFIPKVGGRGLWSARDGGGGRGEGGSGGGGSKPAIGSLCNCGECGKQFAFTKYSLPNSTGEGYLCHPCAKASGNDPFKKKPAPKRKQAGEREREKRTVQSFEERRFPSLVGLCIDILSKHIDDIEAFGDIGSMNMDAISKALSKNRRLTPENATLFYNVTNTSLVFYDATNLTPDAFTTLAHLNPNLTNLRLDFCGQLDDVAMSIFTSGLPALQRIELLGPFLVRVEAWKAFFKAHQKTLSGFLITQSPRFDLECTKALVSCKKLTEVRLKEVGKMDDEMVKILGGLSKGVKLLDVSYPGTSEACTPEAIEGLLKKLGAGLEVLDLSGHGLVDDECLTKGLAKATKLHTLGLDNMPSLTDTGLAAFFSAWSNPALKSLSLARNHELGSEALKALIAHSGSALEELNVNGWGGVDEEGVKSIMGARELRKIDVGFVRAVDDFVVLEWVGGAPNGGTRAREDGGDAMDVDEVERRVVRGKAGEGLRELKEVKVWGCNRVTERCPRRAGLSIFGVESQVIPVR